MTHGLYYDPYSYWRDSVSIFLHGTKIAEGSYEEVSHNESVIEAYLGKKRK